MRDYTKEELKEIHTKLLLGIFNDVRARRHQKEAIVETYTREIEFDNAYMEIIREELSTRPHIPNKKEAKELRKGKPKEKRNK